MKFLISFKQTKDNVFIKDVFVEADDYDVGERFILFYVEGHSSVLYTAASDQIRAIERCPDGS